MRLRNLRLRFDETVQLLDVILNLLELLSCDTWSESRSKLNRREMGLHTLTDCVNFDPAAISATYFSSRDTPGRFTSSEMISPFAVTVVLGAVGKVTSTNQYRRQYTQLTIEPQREGKSSLSLYNGGQSIIWRQFSSKV